MFISTQNQSRITAGLTGNHTEEFSHLRVYQMRVNVMRMMMGPVVWMILACQLTVLHAACDCTECLCISPCILQGRLEHEQPQYLPPKFSQDRLGSNASKHLPICINATIQGGSTFKQPLTSGPSGVDQLINFQSISFVDYQESYNQPFLATMASMEGANWDKIAHDVVDFTNVNNSFSVTVPDVLMSALLPLPGQFNRLQSFAKIWFGFATSNYICASPDCSRKIPPNSTSILLIVPAQVLQFAQDIITTSAVCTYARSSIDPVYTGIFTNMENKSLNISFEKDNDGLEQEYWIAVAPNTDIFDIMVDWQWVGAASVVFTSCVPLVLSFWLWARVDSDGMWFRGSFFTVWNPTELTRKGFRVALTSYMLDLEVNKTDCNTLEYPGLFFHFMISLLNGYFLARIIDMLADLTWTFQAVDRTPARWVSGVFILVTGLEFGFWKLFAWDEDPAVPNDQGLEWLLAPVCEMGPCCTSTYEYSWQDSVVPALLTLACLSTVLSFTKFYAHSIAMLYASFTTLLLTQTMKYTRAENGVR